MTWRSLLWAPPFGLPPLNALHDRLLSADGISPAAAVSWLLAVIPLLPQAYLLLAPGTRGLRACLGCLGITLTITSWLSYRFTESQDNGFNLLLSGAAIFLVVRYIEWSLLVGPINDPWKQLRPRPRLLAALDLTINIRNVFLGSIGLDNVLGRSKSRSTDSRTRRPPVEAYLPQPRGRPQTRRGGVARHAWQVTWRYVLLDIVSALVRELARSTLLRAGGGEGVVNAFVTDLGRRVHHYCGLHLPAVIGKALAILLIPTNVCLWIGLVYHFVAAVTIASTLWPVASWDVDVFDSPFLGDSVIDLWGRRWHQHTFVITASSMTVLLGLPRSSSVLLPLTFASSAAFHVLAHLAMNPVPSSVPIVIFFLSSGLACAAEAMFKRITGHRVRGWWGRLWAWVFLLGTGQPVAEAWLEARFMNSLLAPAGVADLLVRRIRQ